MNLVQYHAKKKVPFGVLQVGHIFYIENDPDKHKFMRVNVNDEFQNNAVDLFTGHTIGFHENNEVMVIEARPVDQQSIMDRLSRVFRIGLLGGAAIASAIWYLVLFA